MSRPRGVSLNDDGSGDKDDGGRMKRMVGRMKRMGRQRGEMCISGFSHVDHRSETVGKVDQMEMMMVTWPT